MQVCPERSQAIFKDAVNRVNANGNLTALRFIFPESDRVMRVVADLIGDRIAYPESDKPLLDEVIHRAHMSFDMSMQQWREHQIKLPEVLNIYIDTALREASLAFSASVSLSTDFGRSEIWDITQHGPLAPIQQRIQGVSYRPHVSTRWVRNKTQWLKSMLLIERELIMMHHKRNTLSQSNPVIERGGVDE